MKNEKRTTVALGLQQSELENCGKALGTYNLKNPLRPIKSRNAFMLYAINKLSAEINGGVDTAE